jgi:hypothetical protein
MIFGMATPPFRVMFLIYRAHRSEIKEETCLDFRQAREG